jgi:hypothetical protein
MPASFSEAGHPGRSYQIATKRATDKYEDLDTWLNKCLEGRRFLVAGVGATGWPRSSDDT